jgi:hypothetical protein
MAKNVAVSEVDDFDGIADADETVEIGIDGISYEASWAQPNRSRVDVVQRERLDPQLLNSHQRVQAHELRPTTRPGLQVRKSLPCSRTRLVEGRRYARRPLRHHPRRVSGLHDPYATRSASLRPVNGSSTGVFDPAGSLSTRLVGKAVAGVEGAEGVRRHPRGEHFDGAC